MNLYTHMHTCAHIYMNTREHVHTTHRERRKVCVEETGLQQRKWVRGKESQCCSRKSGSSPEHGWQGWPSPAAPGWTRGNFKRGNFTGVVLLQGSPD